MRAFVELKKESLRALGRRPMLLAVEGALRSVLARVTFISYDAQVLAMAKTKGHAIGYVLPNFGSRARGIATRLAPQYLFSDRRQTIRAGLLWRGNWRWASFEVATPEMASRLLALGVQYLETMNPAALLAAGFGVETL